MALLMVAAAHQGPGRFHQRDLRAAHRVKAGYALPGGAKAAPTAKPAAPAEVPLPELLAKADRQEGRPTPRSASPAIRSRRAAGAKVGPPLYGVVGRARASIPGFAYSDGMKAKGGNWTYEDINKFITKPSAFVPGTKMTYPGESDPQKRADIATISIRSPTIRSRFPK